MFYKRIHPRVISHCNIMQIQLIEKMRISILLAILELSSCKCKVQFGINSLCPQQKR